jgi:hypothetical protein
MAMCEELIKLMRFCAEDDSVVECQDKCPNFGNFRPYEYCFSKLIAEAADAIEELEEETQAYAETLYAYEHPWIPVTERLPEHLTSVIVHRKDGGIFVWEYFDTSPTDECWIDDSMNIYSFYDVTHWMPLPQPPTECR